MPDIAHVYGQDLTVGPTGDIALALGDMLTQQMVVRRLLTALGDYIQNPDYGAGLGAFVGQPIIAGQIAGVVKRQMKKEASVAQAPPPVVTVASQSSGVVVCTIGYTDKTSGPQSIQFPFVTPSYIQPVNLIGVPLLGLDGAPLLSPVDGAPLYGAFAS